MTTLKVGYNPKKIFLTQTANFVKIYSFNLKPLCCRRRWRAAKAVSDVISMYLNKLCQLLFYLVLF